MPSYSFRNVVAAVDGPGGIVPLSGGIGSAKEGITIAAVGDENVMTKGADDFTQHSMIEDSSATVTVRLLKSSPANALLMALRNFQKLGGSLTWGQNRITVTDVARGDLHVLTDVAFKKVPDLEYASEASPVEWTFDAGHWQPILGTGTPEL
jgi:hypothetical protein